MPTKIKGGVMRNLIFIITFIFLLMTSFVFAQDICESDFDCDRDVDGGDVGTFLEDFGRSQYVNPCPPCLPPEPLPKTGQTSCYDILGNTIDCAGTGQDGEYQLGYVRFADNGDGTVTDNLTGLMWTKDAEQITGLINWVDSLTACNDLTLSTYDDWRLPNIFELTSLIDVVGVNPRMPERHPFINVDILHSQKEYWSSTTHNIDHYLALTMYVYGSAVREDLKGGLIHCWCVRGGQ